MTRRALILVVALFAAVVGLILTRPARTEADRTDAPLTAPVGRRSFEIVVPVVGELDTSRPTVVRSHVRGNRGKIIQIIEDGARVKRGDILVRLDPTPFEEQVSRYAGEIKERMAVLEASEQALQWEKAQATREVKAAEFDLGAAELDLVKLRKGDGPLELARFRGAALKAAREYEEKTGYIGDLQDLKKRGYANDVEINQVRRKAAEAKRAYDAANLQYESYRDHVLPALVKKAHARVARATMDLEQTRKSTGFTIGRAEARLRQARQKLTASRNILDAAQRELAATLIRAPQDGMVVLREDYRGGRKRKPRVGDVVWQNQPLVYLPDVSRMLVKTRVREVDLHKVAVGKPAWARVDAYPALRLEGAVASIGVLAESRPEGRDQDKWFQVVVDLTDGDERLRPGMTARVDIRCGAVKDAVAAPVHALFHEAGRPWVYVALGSGYEKREVALGARNEDWAEVRAGLKPGERVALSEPPPETVRGPRRLAR